MTLDPARFRELRDRYRGALIGLAVGDVLGVPLEFAPPGTFAPVSEVIGGGPFGLRPGEWTDDTSMALCMAESLVLKGGFDAIDQLERYRAWWREGRLSSKGHCFDIGGTVRQALGAYERTRRPDVGCTHERSAGNGSIMRLAPAPLYFAADRTRAIRAAVDSSLPTHAHPATTDACMYLGDLLRQAVLGASKEALLAPWTPPPTVGTAAWGFDTAAVEAIAEGSFKLKEPPAIRGSGYVVDSLEAALWAFHRGADFEEGCKLAVNLGQDADTTGAVYGQLAGAHYGEAGIPARWREKLVMRERIGWFAEALLLGALSQVVAPAMAAFLRPLTPNRLIASDESRAPGQLAADLGPGLFVDVERFLRLPVDARFALDEACDEAPRAGVTYLFVPEVDEP